MRFPSWRPIASAVFTSVLALGPAQVTGANAATGDPVLINEVLASHAGTDDTEFVEFFGDAGASLDGLSLIVVEGDNIASQGQIDRRLDFGADDRLGRNRFYLVGNPAGLAANYGVTPNVSIGNDFFENSTLTVALVQTGSVGPAGSTVTGSEAVLDAVALTDGGAEDVAFFGAPVIGPDGSFFPAGARRVTDGVDTDTAADWAISDFNLGPANTPTGGDTPPPPPATAATIMEIQGTGQFSPLDGERVETTGVVTLFTANGANLWLQDDEGDSDPTTSDGIFVSGGGFPLSGPRPSVGDEIRIVATAEEQQFPPALPLTRLRTVQEVEILSSGNPLPAPVGLKDLPDVSIPQGIAFWEPLEGMLASVTDAKVVAPTTGFGEFVVLAESDAVPGSGYFPQTKQLLVRDLGDGQVDYNPERIMVDDGSLSQAIQAMPGDEVLSLTGAVDFTFGNYKLQPLAGFELETHKPPKPPASRRSGPHGDTVITTFNVENLFDLVDDPVKDDGSSTPTPEALQTKLAKLAAAVRVELRLPEIVVVQEIENTQILQELGDRVNAAARTDYVATSFETSDVRGIEPGFLWDAERVSLRDAFQLSGPDVEAAFGPSSASPGREPLVGVFDVEGNEVTIVANHFKSKSGDDPLFGVNQPPIRVTEEQRKLQAHVVRDFVDGILGQDPDAKVMVAGDLNDFSFAEPGEGPDHPVAILEGSPGELPLTDLMGMEKRAEAFTFVFDGNSQVLDHTLVSPALLDRARAADVLHFNSPFPESLSGDPGTPLRVADHDPLEARFSFRWSSTHESRGAGSDRGWPPGEDPREPQERPPPNARGEGSG